jgi:flagellar hook-length control protein FliK
MECILNGMETVPQGCRKGAALHPAEKPPVRDARDSSIENSLGFPDMMAALMRREVEPTEDSFCASKMPASLNGNPAAQISPAAKIEVENDAQPANPRSVAPPAGKIPLERTDPSQNAMPERNTFDRHDSPSFHAAAVMAKGTLERPGSERNGETALKNRLSNSSAGNGSAIAPVQAPEQAVERFEFSNPGRGEQPIAEPGFNGKDSSQALNLNAPGDFLADDSPAAILRSPPQVRVSIEPGAAPDGSAPGRTNETDLIRQIVQRMTLNTSGRRSSMQIQLKPEFLGNMRMQIMTEDQKVMIRIVTETCQAKEIIERNIEMLKAELQQHGLQIHKVYVAVAPEDEQGRNGQQQMAFRHSRDHHPRQGRGPHGAPVDGRSSNPSGNSASSVQMGEAWSGEVDYFA